MMHRNKCPRCSSKCSRSKAEAQVGGWESDGWTYIGKLENGYALIAYQLAARRRNCQQPERDRGDHEQIHRRDAVCVIAKKRLPSLGWRTPVTHRVGGRMTSPLPSRSLFGSNPMSRGSPLCR